MGEGATQVLSETGADLVCKGAWPLQLGLERLRGFCQLKRLQLRGLARRVFAEKHEIASVGDQDEQVLVPIPADLVTAGCEPGVVAGGLYLHHAALRKLSLPRLALLHLLGGIQAEVRVTRALLRHLVDAEDLGPEGVADRVQQVGQRWIIGKFPGRTARRPYAT